MGFWKAVCTCVGCAVGVGICVVTGGAATPLVATVAIGGGAAGGFLIGDKVDKEDIEREKRLEENQRYKDAKNELTTQENNNNQTQNAIDIIAGKINGTIPRETNETDEYLRTQLTILTSQLTSGKSRANNLRGELDKIRKELSGGGSLMSLLGLNKLGYTDKIMIIAGIILVIWLLKG